MLKRLTTIAALLAVPVSISFGQDLPETNQLPRPSHSGKRLQFEKISTRDGLSQNLVFDATQDKQGFMWFGTQDGLNRYDGKTIKTFDRVPYDDSSLLSSFVLTLDVGPSGRLWVGTGAGLQLYDPATESFERYLASWAEKGGQPIGGHTNQKADEGKESEDDEQGVGEESNDHDQAQRPCISCYGISAILERENGDLWIGSGAGLAKFDTDTRTEDVFRHDPSDDKTLTSRIVTNIFEDQKDKLWVATVNGVNRMNSQTGSFERFLFDPDYSPDGLRNMTMGVPPDPHLRTNLATGFANDFTDPSMIWVATLSGLVHLNTDTGKSVKFRPRLETGDEDVFTDLVQDPSAPTVFWLSTTSSGLYQFDAETKEFKNFRNDPYDETTISTNRLSSIYVDRTNVMWIGTWSGGVNKLDANATKFAEYSDSPGSPLRLTANEVWAVFEDSKGLLWIGTNPGGLNVIDRDNNSITDWTKAPDRGAIPRPEKQWIFSIHEDRSGTMWLGTYNNGVYYRKTGWAEFRKYPYQPVDNGSSWISNIFEDASGRLWISSPRSVGFIDEESGAIVNVYDNPGGGFVYDIAEATDNTLWVGIGGGGLLHLDSQGETIEQFVSDPSDPSGMLDNVVMTVHPSEAESSLVWFGTSDAGLGRFDTDSRSFKFYNKSDGLANNLVYGILEDTEGMLWLSTNRGISRFDPQTENFATFSVEDGAQSEEFNSNAYFKSPTTGEMFFGGVGGLNAFYPQDIIANQTAPQVALTGLRVFNEEVVPGPDSPLEKHVSVADEVRLGHSQKMLTFEFVGLHYVDSDRNQYAYRLDGFNDDWVSAGSENTATFTNLDPGQYTFRVKAANSDGVWNNAGTSIHVSIAPPWWRTLWAYAAYVLMLIAGVFGVDRVQRRRVVARATTRMIEAENQRKSDELEHARELQLSLLPQQPPILEDIDIAAGMRTATEVGGDYYDFNVADDGALVIAIGDATGHGLSAGTVVSATKGIFSLVANESDIEVAMSQCAHGIQRLGLRKLFMAFALARITDGLLELVGGGMPPALVFRGATKLVEEIPLKGLPLGSPLNGHYRKTVVPVASGDVLLLLSDGFPELFNRSREMIGYDRAKQELQQVGDKSPSAILQHFYSVCEAWTDGKALDDDVTFVVVKML